MEKKKNNEAAAMAFDAAEEGSNRVIELMKKSREKRRIYFKGFVSDKKEKAAVCPELQPQVEEWLNEAYELGKREATLERTENNTMDKEGDFDLVKVVCETTDKVCKTMEPTYWEYLMRCEKIISDSRAEQVDILMDKVNESRGMKCVGSLFDAITK